jgi:hydroxymethylbilane synthase
MTMNIKIATRQSKLALIQTNLVISEIKNHFPDVICEIVPVVTTGDKITNINLYDVGGKALFLKELEEKLIAHEVDLAVHSLKDVPGILPEGLELSAMLEREDPRDCFVSHKYKSVQELPHSAIVGSSSVRRKVILEKMRPDLNIVQCRGNVQTRLAKLESENLDAIILACAGLKRADLFDERYCFPFALDEMIPSAGQGIIVVQTRIGDSKMAAICAKINHLPTWHLAEAERQFLVYFDASCRTPISAYAEYIDDKTIKARYMYGDFDGSFLHFATETGGITEAKEIAVRAAKRVERR